MAEPTTRVTRRELLIAGLTAPLAQVPAAAGDWRNVSYGLARALPSGPSILRLWAVPGMDMLVASTHGQGPFGTTDGGITWTRLGGEKPIDHITVQVLFDPKDSRIWYVSGMYGPGLFRTGNAGRTFERIGDLTHLEGVGVDFTDELRRTILVGVHEKKNAVMRSVSAGTTWQNIGGGLPASANYSHYVFVFDAMTYVVSTSGFAANAQEMYRTTDGGKTWRRVASVGAHEPGLMLSDGTCYVRTFYNSGVARGDLRGQVWRTLDSRLRVTPVELPGKALLSAGDRQLYISRDRGDTWKPFGPQAPIAIRSVAYNDVRKAVYAMNADDGVVPGKIYRLNIA
jgi:photosystem II stability/assembly factor-like uncharacterized protein